VDNFTIDTPECHIAVVTDGAVDHCICEFRPTDSDKPDNGWVTIMPVAYLLGNASASIIANAISKEGKECRIITTSFDIISKFEEGTRQIALLDGNVLRKLPIDVGEMMKNADWLELHNGKTIPMKVTIHHE
jgi:hypothetical protein